MFSRDLRKLNTVSDYLGQLVIDKDNEEHFEVKNKRALDIKEDNAEYEIDPSHSGVDIFDSCYEKKHLKKIAK